MSSWTEVTVSGALAVVLFDAIAAFAARKMDVPYAWATVGSWILYGGFGYLSARAYPAAPIQAALLTGVVLGVTDATAGWATSWAIGAGRVAELTVAKWLVTVISVAGIAAGVAALGAVAA
ncbi:MAG TPA: hypothetical protein VJW73_14925 [Gemmatimonadaceae bacterium]|nr:hypothetical protein [Gemmatimonadaceae bacterium]